MAFNSCTPSRIYGPLEQTLFLGMTVQDFSATAGWNEQFSTVTVNLVQDDCAGTRYYFDTNFNWTSAYFADGDPGFNQAQVGSPVFFKIGNFEFGGIIQSYNLSDDPNGRNILTANLISPGIIMEGTQVIIDEYVGSIGDIPNIINAFGFLESLGADCPFSEGFGSPAGGFGNAQQTARGVPWKWLKQALQVLLGGLYTAAYSKEYILEPGVIQYRPGVGTYGSIINDKYIVDIDDLPTVDDINYRIPGPTSSLMELISAVCNDGGYDYYVDFLPTKSNGTFNPITNVIKIRTISRVNSPGDEGLQDIVNFINEQNSQQKLISQSSLGQELRPDYNSAFIIGGQKEQLYQQLADPNPTFSDIVPFWGYNFQKQLLIAKWNPIDLYDEDLNPYRPGGDPQWYVQLDYQTLNYTLNVPFTALLNGGFIPETALCASKGDFQSFWEWVFTHGRFTDLFAWATDTGYGLGLSRDLFRKRVKSRAEARSSRSPKAMHGLSPVDIIYQDLETVYKFVQNYTNEQYGKQFLVAVPFVCYRTDPDTNQILYTDETSNEGWVDSDSVVVINTDGTTAQPGVGSVLGLTHRESTDVFSSEVGKLSSFIRWDYGFSRFDNSEANGVTAVATDTLNGSFWVKADVEQDWIIASFNGEQKVAALLKTEYVPLYKPMANESGISPQFVGALGSNFRTGLIPTGLGDGIGRGLNSSDSYAPAFIPFSFPYGAVVPIKSNTQTYGPWYGKATDVKGNVYVEKDDGLVPWEYGDSSYMTDAVRIKIQNQITAMQKAERGSVTVAGYPEKQLGTALSDSPILITDRVLQQKSYNGYYFYYIDVGGVSEKASQITNLNVTVGGSAITTQYTLSTFTPVKGRFTKGNAERLKQIGQQNFKTSKKFRALAQGGIKTATTKQASNVGSSMFGSRSPISILAGEYHGPDPDHSGLVRKTIVGQTDNYAALYQNYNSGCMMSLDGLFRPVQNRQSTISGIPVANDPGSPTSPFQPKLSESPAGPLSAYTGLIINSSYLNFLTNPGSDLSQRASGHPGHDIEFVARSTTGDIQTNNFGYMGLFDTGTTSYTSDYRYMALRGPLVIHGWGYDIMGKPIPNSNETGIFSGWDGLQSPTSGNHVSGLHRKDYNLLTDQFHSGWLQDSTTWPVGPVDLRFDRRRGVWTIPNDFRLYLVDLYTPISGIGDTGNGLVLNADDVYDGSGGFVSTGIGGRPEWELTVTNPFDDEISAGKILVYYSHESGQYWPVQACCGGTTSSGPPPDPSPPCVYKTCSEIQGCVYMCEPNTSPVCYLIQDKCGVGCKCPETIDRPRDCGDCVDPDTGKMTPCPPCSFTYAGTCGYDPCGQADGGHSNPDGLQYYMSYDNIPLGVTPKARARLDGNLIYGKEGVGIVGIEPQNLHFAGSLAFLTGVPTLPYFEESCTGLNSDPDCVFTGFDYSRSIAYVPGGKYNLPSGTEVMVSFFPRPSGKGNAYLIDEVLNFSDCSSQTVTGEYFLWFYPIVLANPPSGVSSITLHLPLTSQTGFVDKCFTVKKINSHANTVILSASGSDQIDGSSTYTLYNQYESVKVVSDGSNWHVI